MTTNTTARRSAEHTRQTILTALAATRAPLTVTELADAAGLGKSTLAKHLLALEKDGLARRTPGCRDGRRRLPDSWASAVTTTDEDEAPATVPDPDTAPDGSAGTPEETTGTDLGQTTSGTVTADPGSEDCNSGEAVNTAPGKADTAASLSAVTAPSAGPAQPALVTQVRAQRVGEQKTGLNPISGSARLAPGELKLMVKAILDADPGEEFTATAISHILQGRSIGAIQNNLARLSKEERAVQTSDKPRRYQSVRAVN
ncbi:IclR-like helix-turn-helix domain-containing protein [Nocardiopsis sp. Huas11]|uniref:winged helix-turn-helix domain-containing protein n=1 Tax=Nocardiopsis sp. Huas11 TaxID=2183912 RepID=UPI000EAF50AA|nr:winged helix-turn-helix domain-containing protein [Nocardiopsis sp. Huas11]RKS04962.1 IclR-like helix-turn-helix domain-containing protein [Nocardiopsis sp. Huas11]